MQPCLARCGDAGASYHLQLCKNWLFLGQQAPLVLGFWRPIEDKPITIVARRHTWSYQAGSKLDQIWPNNRETFWSLRIFCLLFFLLKRKGIFFFDSFPFTYCFVIKSIVIFDFSSPTHVKPVQIFAKINLCLLSNETENKQIWLKTVHQIFDL